MNHFIGKCPHRGDIGSVFHSTPANPCLNPAGPNHDDQFRTNVGRNLVVKRDQFWSKFGHTYTDDQFATNIGRILVMIYDHFWSRIGHAYPDDQFHTTFGQDLVMKRDQLWSESGHYL